MKRNLVIIIVLLCFAPVTMFADDGISVGVTALLPTPITINNVIENPQPYIDFLLDPNLPGYLLYGGELRFDYSLFQVGANVFYSPWIALDNLYGFVNAGVNLDLGPIGLGLTAGPYLYFENGVLRAFRYNTKLALDVKFGPLILSANVMTMFDELDLEIFMDPANLMVYPGVAVLLQL